MMKNTTSKLSFAAVSIAASGLLAACGGGSSGSGGDEPSAGIDPVQLKGRWVASQGVAPAMTAVVVPDASGVANAWLLAQDASRLVKLVVRSDRSANGKSYALNQGSATGQAVSGQVASVLTASPKSISFTGVNAGLLTLVQSDALLTPAALADAAGAWTSTSGGKSQTVQWGITTAGSLNGSSTTGCTYSGNLSAVANTAAYGVLFSEICPDGVKTTFSGIATIDAPKSGLTVVVASVDETKGAAIFFTK